MNPPSDRDLRNPGAPDPTFGVHDNGTVVLSTLAPEFGTYPLIKGLALQPDGKIIFSARNSSSGVHVYALARLNSDGSLDRSFAQEGIKQGHFIDSNTASGGKLALHDSKILMAGWTLMEPPDDWAHLAITRILETGNVDQAFGEHGRVVIENRAAQKFAQDSETLRVHTDGTLLFSANYVDPDNLDFITGVVFRYRSDGKPDESFNRTGRRDFHANDERTATTINTCLIQGTQILLAGHAILQGVETAYVARLNADGSLDRSFGNIETPGMMTLRVDNRDTRFNDLAQRPDGSLICIGQVGNYPEPDVKGLLVALTPGGQPHLLFNEGKPLQTQYDSELMNRWKCGYSQPDGSIVTVSGTYPVYIARFRSNGVPDSDFGNAGHIDLEARIITDPAQLLCRTGNRILFSINNVGVSPDGVAEIRSFLG